MNWKPPIYLAAGALALLCSVAWADQIILKDGTVYSGKFVRGDANSVEFRILSRVETFKIPDVAQIVFKEPELESSPVRNPKVAAQPGTPSAPTPALAQKTLNASTGIGSSEPIPAPPAASAKEPPVPVSAGTGITLPVGTPVTIRTSTAIDTDRNRVGDVFDASLDQALVWGNQTIFPRGTTVKGRIAYAKESGKLSGQAQLILELTEIMANGRSYLVRTSDYMEAGTNRANRTAATVGGTAALGAIIGAIAGGGTGAAVGAASGAAVGTGVQVMTRGQVLRIPAETILEFRLQSPLSVDVP